MGPQIDTGQILARSVSTFSAQFGVFAVLTILYVAPLAAITLAASLESELAIGLNLLLIVVSLVLGPLLTAAAVHAYARHRKQLSVSVGDCLELGGSLWLQVALASILVSFLVGIGFLLLIIPGIIAYAGLFVAIPALVVERPGIVDSLHRSWDLTNGHRLRIFFIVLSLTLIGLVVGGVLGLLDAMALGDSPASGLLPLLGQGAVTVFSALIAAVTYFELRQIREGMPFEDLVRVFD